MGNLQQRFERHISIIIVKIRNICGCLEEKSKNIIKTTPADVCLIIHIAKLFTIKIVIIKIKTLFL